MSDPMCECPKCGRLHRDLQAGTPPAGIRTAPAKEASAEAESRSEPLTDERLAELAVWDLRAANLQRDDIRSMAHELQSRRSSPVREGEGENQERILPAASNASMNKEAIDVDAIKKYLRSRVNYGDARMFNPLGHSPEAHQGLIVIDRIEADKDAAYEERNRLVALLASMFPSGIARTAIPGWLPEWHGCVYIDLPCGQASWHYHDSQAHLFAHLPPYTKPWDGHTTEQKYERISQMAQSNDHARSGSPSLSPSEPSGRGESGGIQGPASEASMNKRDARQKTVIDWCVASFGEDAATSLSQRSVRLLEETIEAYQAAGGSTDMAHKLIDFVFGRPVGELSQEIGGVGLTLLSLAQAAGVSADAEEDREVRRVLAKPSAHWAARNANKNAAGFDTSAPVGSAPPSDEGGRMSQVYNRPIVSALESARRIVEIVDGGASNWTEQSDIARVARAYIAACEALEAIEALSIQAPVKKIARAGLSCPAPPSEK